MKTFKDQYDGQKVERGRFRLELNDTGSVLKPEKKKSDPKGLGQTWYYLGYIGEIGFTIAIPIAGGAFIGTYIDQRWSTYPRATLSLLFVGVFLSMVSFIITIRDIINRKN